MAEFLTGPQRLALKATAWRYSQAHTAKDARTLAEATGALLAERDRLADLVRDLADPDPCSFDHHGGCQAHGYLDLKPGEKCPHAEAKELLGEDSR